MSVLRALSYYDEHAQNVDLDDITSSVNNAEILQMLRDDDPGLSDLWITQQHNFEDAFFLQGGNDLGWLGYFIGRNTKLRNLRIYCTYMQQITALLRGIEQSKSIRELDICGDHNVLSFLSAMLQSERCCLTSLSLNNIPLNDDAAAALADALKGCKSLTDLSLWDDDLSGYREQIPILIRGIEQSRSIQKLVIDGDRLGESVLNSLSAMLQSCCLASLSLGYIALGDDVAVALADALKGNKSLKHLLFLFNPDDLTRVGWSAFSELLCDTSSVNNTHASNHTLQEVGYFGLWSNHPQDVKQLLALNGLPDKHAAIQKILKYHPDFDVETFLGDKSKRKLLPLVMSWFERVARQQAESERSKSARFRGIFLAELVSTEEIQKRQLSTMCKVVRSMPLEAIDGYRRFSAGKELQEPKVGRHTYRSYSSHKKRKFDLLGRNFHTLVLLCLLTLVLPLL